MEDSKGILIRNAAPVFTSTIFNNNYYGLYVESGECPGLAGVSFGEEEEANSVEVWSSSCRQ